jgi:ammonium transporter, Amt family
MKKYKFLMAAALAFLPLPALAEEAAKLPDISGANTAWVLISAALVMLMTPGLAFFYAGMVRRKNVVSTLFKNFAALAVIGVLWFVAGYSIAFAPGNEWFGSWQHYFMLKNVGDGSFVLNGSTYDIPHKAFMLFQMMFAIITPALIIGSLVERINFKAWLVIMSMWSIMVYAPIAHWVWGEGGWIFADGGLDFAGGLVVHISSGVSALVAALMFGRRVNANEPSRPNDVSMVLLGAALLWFGWFGFNAGSALAANGLAAHAFGTTFIAAATGFLGWMLYDWITNGKPSAVGSAVGLVAGLVVITPAAGFVSLGHAMIMGFIGGLVCNMASRMIKKATRLDDSLDVFGCHGVGGILGALMTGLFASKAVNGAVANQGYLIDGSMTLLKANFTATAAVIAYAVIMTFVLIKFAGLFMKLRVSEEEELAGLDDSQHGEFARYREQISH